MIGIDQQIEARANEILTQLTLDEKCRMMYGDMPFWAGIGDMVAGGYAHHTWNAGALPQLGIGGIRFADGPRGLVLEGATTFPVTMARGATWDTELEERVGKAMGSELRSYGGNLFGGVCINLLRHPAWGRAQETYGEDPYHLGEMGAALTLGVQQHAMACVKHFALNSMENSRFTLDVRISSRPLHEIYLPHFKRVVDQGVAAVMSAYNSVNGEWCGQHKILLSDILKMQWGFKGFVLSDFVFGMRDAQKAALAGQDLEMPFPMLYHKRLKKLAEEGRVPVERIDDAVLRLLRGQFSLPSDSGYSSDLVGCEKHRELAREAARKSFVLLKNERDLLPLKNTKKLAVIGRLAGIPNTGDRGSSNTHPAYVVTPLKGIEKALAGKTDVHYHDGADLTKAQEVARSAEAVILVVGYTYEDEGEFVSPDTRKALMSFFPRPSLREIPAVLKLAIKNLASRKTKSFSPGGDRDLLTLRSQDEDLIRAVTHANPNTIVAVMGGSAIIMENWRELAPAILMIWYPGMEGGHALADVLFGKVSPGGKLPFVIPASAEHLPFFDRDATEIEYDLWHGYRKLDRDGNQPAFAFGFGLSYTTFSYSDLILEQDQLKPEDTIKVSLQVTNTGEFAGEEVVQLYVSAIGSSVERPPKELKAFTRISLQPGETRPVIFELPVVQLAYFDETQMEFVVEPIEYELMAGSHSLDPNSLKARFSISG